MNWIMRRVGGWAVIVAMGLCAPTLSWAQGKVLYNASTDAAGGTGTLALSEKYNSVLVEVTIAGTAEVEFTISGEGAQPTAVACTDYSSTSFAAATSATATGTYLCPTNGASGFQISVGAHTGAVRVYAAPSSGSARRGGGGGGGGSGTVTSVTASGGVETSSGAAITGSGTIRGNMCVRAVTGTTDTILSTDRGCLITYSNANPIAVTLPEAGTAGFDAGFSFSPVNLGAGTVTITPTTSEIQGGVDVGLTTGKGIEIASDGTNYFYNPGIGLTTEAQSLNDVCTVDCEITTANSEANAVMEGDGTNKVKRWWDATLGYVIKPEPLGNTAWRCWTNFNCIVRDEEGDKTFLTIDPDALGAGSGTLTLATSEQLVVSNLGVEFAESDTNPTCAAGNYNIYADTSEAKLKKCQNGTVSDLDGGRVKSFWVGARNLEGDGAQCPARPTAVTINTGSAPKVPTFICTDNDSSRLDGSLRMPPDWNGGTITFTHSYIQTAADTGALNGDIAAQCRGTGETPSSTWGSEVAIDDAAVTGSNANDLTTSAAVTPAGTCAAGDMLYFKYELDATGTTTAVATLHHLGFHVTYTSTAN